MQVACTSLKNHSVDRVQVFFRDNRYLQQSPWVAGTGSKSYVPSSSKAMSHRNAEALQHLSNLLRQHQNSQALADLQASPFQVGVGRTLFQSPFFPWKLSFGGSWWPSWQEVELAWLSHTHFWRHFRSYEGLALLCTNCFKRLLAWLYKLHFSLSKNQGAQGPSKMVSGLDCVLSQLSAAVSLALTMDGPVLFHSYMSCYSRLAGISLTASPSPKIGHWYL